MWNKMTGMNHVLYLLLHITDKNFSLHIVSPDRVVEVPYQVRRHHDVNRPVQSPGAGPEVHLQHKQQNE